MIVIVKAASVLELDGVVENIPIWPLMETSVIPLSTFEDRKRPESSCEHLVLAERSALYDAAPVAYELRLPCTFEC